MDESLTVESVEDEYDESDYVRDIGLRRDVECSRTGSRSSRRLSHGELYLGRSDRKLCRDRMLCQEDKDSILANHHLSAGHARHLIRIAQFVNSASITW